MNCTGFFSGLNLKRRLSSSFATVLILTALWTTNSRGQTAPSVTTGSATDINGNDATVSGYVTPNGARTAAWFAYGLTNGYGSVSSFDTVDDHRYAVKFDDADSNEITTPNSINFAYSDGGYQSFTIEAWAKRNPNGTADCIVGQGASSLTDQQDLYFGFESSSNGNVFEFTFSTESFRTVTTSVGYTDTLWHQWVGVWDGSKQYLYLYQDGHLVASTFNQLVDQTDAPIVIGRDTYDATSYFNGEISQVRIWGTALDSTTIQEWMSRNVISSHPYYSSLLAEWIMNEGSGTTVGDSSGHGDSGSLQRSSWTTSGWSAPFETSITGLTNGATYHYRLSAINSAGTTNGNDSVFTTIGIPSIQTSNLEFSSIGKNSATLTWTNGNGSDRIVVVRADSSLDTSNVPTNNTSYTANSSLGIGSEIGTSAYVVYVGSGNTVSITNLPEGNYIAAAVYELNDLSSPVYDTASPAKSTEATITPSYSTSPGTALYFNGTSSYVDIQNSGSASELNFRGSFTIEGWFKTNGPFSSQSWIPIVNKGNGAWRIQRYNSTDHLDFGTNGLSQQDLEGSTTIDDGKWHFFAAVYNASSSTKFLYVDGNADAEAGSVSGSLASDNDDLAIGYNLGASNGYFNGDVDEVRIYNVARTQQQIHNDMFSTTTGAQNGLVSYWQFSEGTGSTTADSVSGLNGTLTGSPAWQTSNAPVGEYGKYDATTAADSVGVSGANLNATITSTPDSVNLLGLYSFGSVDDIFIASETFPSGVNKRSAVIWGVFGVGTNTANLTLNYSSFPGIQNESTLKVLRREESDSAWTDATSGFTHNTSSHTFTATGVSALGQFAIGAGGDNTFTFSAPSVQDSNLTFSNIGRNSATLIWTNGNGTDRIVVMRNDTTMDSTNIPGNGTIYGASSTFGNGSEIGTGGYVVYSGSGNSVSVTGLTAGNYFTAEVFEFNNPSSPVYLTTSPAKTTQATTTPKYASDPGEAIHCSSGSSSYISIQNSGTSSQFSLESSFTIEGWIKTDGAFTSQWAGIVCKGDNAWRIQRYSSTDNLDFGTSGLSSQDLQGSTTVDDGKWHFFAAVFDGSNKYLYVDGRLDASASGVTGTLGTDAFDVTIGNNLEATGRIFSGEVDEIRIWDNARTEQQVRNDMFSAVSGPQIGLVSYWQFNEGTGTTTTDSVSGFQGTLVNPYSLEWVASGAPVGGYGSYDASASADSTGPLGDMVTASIISPVDSLNYLGLYSYGTPNDTAVTDETFPVGITKRSPLVWGIFAVGNDTANVTLNYSGLGGIQNEPGLKVLERTEADSPWLDVTSGFTQNVANHTFSAAGTHSLGQFSIGGGTDNSLPVQASDFLATAGIGSVTLSWKTQSELDNAGFNILREDPGTPLFKVVSTYTGNDSLRGLGTNSTGKIYDYTDNKVISGSTYKYKIQSVSTSGITKDLSTLSVTVDVPKTYALYQNYPNPFNPSTTIRFDLKQQSVVHLDFYNTLGQRVGEFNYGTMNAGRYNESLNLGALASGVYFYRIVAEGQNGEEFVSLKKLVLLK